MIVDVIDRYAHYTMLTANFDKAFEFLRTEDLASLTEGKHQIDGDDLFALVQRYEVKPADDGLFEVHKKYIDIQYVVSGSELIGYAPKGSQEVIHAYDESADDYALYKGEASFIKLEAGMFAICFPDDLHMPGIGEDMSKVQKIVMKVKI